MEHILPRSHQQPVFPMSQNPQETIIEGDMESTLRIQKLIGMLSSSEGRIFLPSFVHCEVTLGELRGTKPFVANINDLKKTKARYNWSKRKPPLPKEKKLSKRDKL